MLFVFIIVMFFNCRFFWLDNIIIKSLLINGLDIGWYVDINGVIKMIVYNVYFNYIVWFFKCYVKNFDCDYLLMKVFFII